MNINMRRNILRLVAGVAAAATLVGTAACGSSNGSTGSNGKLQLSISYWDDEMEYVKQFIKQNPDIEVKQIRVPGDDYNNKLNQMVVGNQAPDVMDVQESDYPRFAKNGVLDKLDLKELGVNEKDMQSAVKALGKDLNGYYGLGNGYAVELMFYNKDLFDAAGVAYPTNDWTWDDYTAAAEKLTDSSKGQYGSDSPTFNGVWYSLIGAAGDNVVKNGKLSFGNGLKETLEWQKKLVDNKWQPEPASGSKVSDMFAAGKAAMTLGGNWLVSTYKDVDFNWGIATIPVPEGGRAYNSMHTSFWGISKKSKNKEAAKRFMKFIMSEKGIKPMSEELGNFPIYQSMVSKGWWQVKTKHGPTDWSAMEQAAKEAKFGYTQVSSTATFDLYDQFNAYVLGQTYLKEATTAQVDKANKEITDAQ